jgi:glutathione S-transferase
LVLVDSSAIVTYIARKAKSPLAPAGDIRKEALLDQALAIEATSFDANMSSLVGQRVFVPLLSGKPGNEERVQELAGNFEARLAGYEVILSKHKYLAGNEISIADLKHLPWGSFLSPQGFTWLEDSAKYPNIARCVFVALGSGPALTIHAAGGRTLGRANRGRRRKHSFTSQSMVPTRSF